MGDPTRRSAANRFGWDYRLLARAMPAQRPIIDIHAHNNGRTAGAIWKEAAALFGVTRVHTMVRLSEAPNVQAVLGDMVRFIAFPDFRADRQRAMTEGFLEDIQAFHDRFGSKMVKLWNAPRMREFFPGNTGVVEFDGSWRLRHARLAESLGMMFMVHVADPDTWFATRYGDAAVYGRKLDHYRGLRAMLDRFKGPWIAAHMGGWPEDLVFLSSMLEAHSNLYLDTSATKWVVRTLSAQPRERVVEFFERWRGRLLFGSDIVTTDEHLTPQPGASPMSDLADSPAAAFELYASRYWALRTMFESDYDGESPIADPDLAMVDPLKHDAMSAPRLRGLGLRRGVLDDLYGGAAERLLAGM